MRNTATGSRPKAALSDFSPFTRRALAFMDSIECRPIVTSEDLEDLYRFRYRCYRLGGWVESNEAGALPDVLDEATNVTRFGLYRQGRMVSSIRFNHLTRSTRQGPSMFTHADILNPLLDTGLTMIDPSRVTIDAEDDVERTLMPYVTVRMAGMASLHFDVDYSLSLVRPTHAAFYRKVFGSRPIEGLRSFPGVNFPVQLMIADIRDARDATLARYPFFDSLESERRALFGERPNPRAPFDRRSREAMRRPLTVRPSADLALGLVPERALALAA